MSAMTTCEEEVHLSDLKDESAFRRAMFERWIQSDRCRKRRTRRRRQLAVYYLNLDGWTYSQIGSALRINKATVCRYIEQARESMQSYFRETNIEREDFDLELS